MYVWVNAAMGSILSWLLEHSVGLYGGSLYDIDVIRLIQYTKVRFAFI